MRSLIPLSLRVALALAVPAALAGCANETSTSSGGAESGDDDDDDDGATPDPDSDPDPGDPDPEPSGTYCSISWYAQGSSQEKLHLYIVEMPLSEWTSGQKNFGGEISGVFVYDADEQGNAADEAYATGGGFDLQVSGTNPGDGVTFDDGDEQTYDGAEASIARDGRGSFDGVLSDAAADQWTTGNGGITVEYDGNSVQLEEPDAGCIDEGASSPFAPVSTVDRILRRHHGA